MPFANFVSSPELTDDGDQFDTRVDYRGDGLSVTSRYSFADRRLFEPFAGPGFSAVPGFGNDVPRRAQSFVVSATSQAGSRWLNEARVAWTRVASGVFQEGQGTSLNRQVGLPELSANPRDWGLSLINVAGYASLGHEFNNPQDSRTNHWQIADTLTWTTGRHLVRFGGEVRLLRQEAFRDVQARGLLTFTNQAFTGNGLADLLLGLPTVTVGATLDNPQNLQASSYAAFVQDSLEVSPTLTVSAGVRYELNMPPVDANNRVNLYDPATGTLVPVGTGDMPRAGYEADRNNFAPRLGVAWTARESTVVRGGYGISYDQAALAPNEFLYFNAPYFNLNTYFTLPASYMLTLFDPFPADFPLPLPKSATAVDPDLRTGHLHHWNVSVQQRLGRRQTVEVAYVGSLGRNLVARPGHQSTGAVAGPVQPPPEPALRRHPDDRIAGAVALQRPRASVRSAARSRRLGDGVLHAWQVDGRRLVVFLERGRREFSDGQQQSRSGMGTIEFRRATPVHARRVVADSDRPQPPVPAGRFRRDLPRQLGPLRRRRAAERPAIHRGHSSGHRQQQYRPRQSRLRIERPAERCRRPVGRRSRA